MIAWLVGTNGWRKDITDSSNSSTHTALPPTTTPSHPFNTTPTTKKVYRFLFFFSLAGVLYLLSVARVLLSGSPFTNVRAKEGGLTQQEMGWAVVEVR